MEMPLKKKKIIYLITKSNWGGAQRYVYDLATKVPKDLYDVVVIVGGNGPLVEKLREAGIEVRTIERLGRDVHPIKDLGVFVDLYSVFHREKPDIIHLNSSKIGGIGAVAGRMAGVPKIFFTAHGWAFNEDRSFASKIFIKFLYWLTMLFSHRTIAVSNMMKEQANWPMIAKKISVVYNGISAVPGYSKTNARLELIKDFPELTSIIKATKATDLVWIGTIAELHPIKGHEYAIKGIRNLVDRLAEKQQENQPAKRIIYTIIGTGEIKNELTELVKKYNLENIVFFLGHVDQAAHYLKAFDIFLLASLSEGLAYVLLEAGCAAIPCVATSVGGIPEVIDDMQSGILIRAKQPQEINHALEFLIHHKNIQREHGKNLQEKVLRQFSLDKMVMRTLELYETSGDSIATEAR